MPQERKVRWTISILKKGDKQLYRDHAVGQCIQNTSFDFAREVGKYIKFNRIPI